MDAMFFHVEQRSAWIRTLTHTVVLDREADFERFAKDRTGSVQHILRFWLAEPNACRPHLRAYLGALSFWAGDPAFSDLCRLFRFTSRAAKAFGQSPRELRHRLERLLRNYVDSGQRLEGIRK
ncbi:MAG: hypothetical protein ACYS8Z_17055 [Planctomycetota bacterium]|jgi:hypothetical protein